MKNMNQFARVSLKLNGAPYEGLATVSDDGDWYKILEDKGDFSIGEDYRISRDLVDELDADIDDDYFDSDEDNRADYTNSVISCEMLDEGDSRYKHCVDVMDKLEKAEKSKKDELFNRASTLRDLAADNDFARVSFIDDDSYYYMGDKAKPYWEGLVRVHSYDNSYDSDGYIMFDILKTEMSEKSNKTFGRLPIEGDYSSHRLECISIKDLTDAEREQCKDYAKKFDDLHANAPYKIIGRIFSDKPTYYEWDDEKKYPRYNELENLSKEWTVDEVHSLQDAEKWLLSNHPDYYMGCSIVQNCPSGNFLASAVPCGEYPKGMYETIENRRDWARKKAAEFGVEIGPFEYQTEKSVRRNKNHSERELPDIDYGNDSEYDNTFDK